MALRQRSHVNIGVLLVILGIPTLQRSDGFNLQHWLSTQGSKYGPNKRIAANGATGLESGEDEDDLYIKTMISKTCPSGYFRDQEDRCVPLNDVPVASGGGGRYVRSFSGGGPASCQKGQYLDHHSGQCGVCPAECLGDTRSASSSHPRSVTCSHGQHLTASGQCASIFPIIYLYPPGKRQYTSNPHPHVASRSLISSPEAGCPPGQTLTPDGKCPLILYPSIPGRSFAVASSSILSPPEAECPPGQSLKPDGKCALIPNPPVLTGICPPGQTSVPPYGQCAPLHASFLYQVLHHR